MTTYRRFSKASAEGLYSKNDYSGCCTKRSSDTYNPFQSEPIKEEEEPKFSERKSDATLTISKFRLSNVEETLKGSKLESKVSTRADSKRSNTFFQKNMSGFGGSGLVQDNF